MAPEGAYGGADIGGDGCDGGADPAVGLPNMLVNSPGFCAAGAGWAASGGAPGNPWAEGNCGGGLPGAGALKNRVNSPPPWDGAAGCGGVPGAAPPPPAWNICVKAPGVGLAAAGGGQSPSV